jgi:hypothetical protein
MHSAVDVIELGTRATRMVGIGIYVQVSRGIRVGWPV